jgi:hypothetical protein
MRSRSAGLAHVLWIGGAPDSGKSTAARALAERRALHVYHYDSRDLVHHEMLAAARPDYRAFLEASMDERWVHPRPEALLQRSLRSFHDRFGFLLEDVSRFPPYRPSIVEGFGLLPELVAPLLRSPVQAVWLVPTERFKEEAMKRRGKPAFGPDISDAAKARRNLIQRDRLLTDVIREQAQQRGCDVWEIDEALPVDELTDRLERRFSPFLDARRPET